MDPEIAVGSISAIFGLCSKLGHWKRIAFQGANFPSKNLAKHGQDIFVQRNEWAVFHERAEREGWKIVDSYCDRSISGASLIRPGIQALMADAQESRFDIVLSESLDRISRDQENIAGIYKRFTFADVRIVTLSEGGISELHICLKGTMRALYLKDLADKTRRGLRGCIEEGKSGGGNSYGYRFIR